MVELPELPDRIVTPPSSGVSIPGAKVAYAPPPEAGLERIGIVAGQGQFPLLLARAARDQGIHVTGFGLEGFATTDFANSVDEIEWVELGQFSRLIELLRTHKIDHIALVGRVPHNSIWQYRHFDVRVVKILATTFNRRADGLLARICEEFRKEGIEVIDSTLFLRSFMPKVGHLTQGRKLTESEQEDIEFGLPLARAVAGLDIGQTIVVKDKAVVAVEGLEGTDRCVRRAAEIAGPGVVIVKVSKPRQDTRFDVPVIGMRTIELMIEVKASVIAISAGETLVFNQEEVIARAEAAGISIVAVENVPPALPIGLAPANGGGAA